MDYFKICLSNFGVMFKFFKSLQITYFKKYPSRTFQVSIEKNLVCDLIMNCDNAEDEINCTEDRRFYCESGTPLFITEFQVCKPLKKSK